MKIQFDKGTYATAHARKVITHMINEGIACFRTPKKLFVLQSGDLNNKVFVEITKEKNDYGKIIERQHIIKVYVS